MTDTIQSLLRQHVSDPTIAVKYGGLQWTWSQYLAESAARAAALITIADPQRPTHIGSLLGNTPRCWPSWLRPGWAAMCCVA